MNDIFNFFSPLSFVKSGTVAYNPYINYSWSQTLTVGGSQQIKDSGTAGLNLQQFFGQGCWFNGIDQNIVLETSSPPDSSQIWTICFNVNTSSNGKYVIRTIGGSIKILWFNGGLGYYSGSTNIKLDPTNSNRAGSYVVSSDGNNIYTYLNNVLISTVTQNSENLTFGTIREIGGIITGASTLYLGIIKDVYYFRKNITETERSNYFNQPNQFFMDSLEDSGCILAMPMCEKNNLVKNYKNNTDYPITNYLTTCRTNAQRLPYGLQTSGFKRDTNGLILSKSNFLEADGVGYGNTGNYIDSLTDFSMEFIGLFKTSSTEQAHGVGYSNAYNRITFSTNSSGKLFSRCGGTVVNYSNVSLFDISNYLTLTFVQSTKIFKLYLNGNYVGQVSNANFISTGGDYTIGAQGSNTYAVNGDVRLFKVHNKVLTQEEVSKNFNKYQAQGLLNE